LDLEIFKIFLSSFIDEIGDWDVFK
jgi:hypothetical protein